MSRVIGMAGFFVGLVLGAVGVQAASTDADGTYTVTVTKVEVSKDGGTTYTTLFDGSQAINIAAVDAGAVAAGLASGAALEAGIYNTVRVTIGATLLAKGYVNSGGDTVYTNGSGSATNSGATSTPGAGYAASTYTIPEANRIETTTGLSIPVELGKGPTVTVKFDTSGVLSQISGTIIPGEPSVTISSR